MKHLRGGTALGYPYHGLASGGAPVNFADGKSVTVYGTGSCIEARHPSAPGANRNTAELAADAARGWVWRDYALLTGDNRAFNGSIDAQMGPNGWLYVDTNGLPWRITIEQQPPDFTNEWVEIQVWRRALFGRFKYLEDWSTITDEQIGSYKIVPVVPTWYGGSYLSVDLLVNLFTEHPTCTVPNEDGSNCIVNVYSTSGIAREVFPETTTGWGTSYDQRTLVEAFEIDLSGAGDLDLAGVGISATFNQLYDGPGLISGRVRVTGSTGSLPTFNYSSNTTLPDIPCDTIGATFTGDETFSVNGLASGSIPYYQGQNRHIYTGILFVHHSGNITRYYRREKYGEFWYQESGSYSADVVYECTPTGWEKHSNQTTRCPGGINTLSTATRQRQVDDLEITYTFFDVTETYTFSAHRDDDSGTATSGFYPSDRGVVNFTCELAVGQDPQVLGTPIFTFLVNGETYPSSFATIDELEINYELRFFSNNTVIAHLHYYTTSTANRYKRLRIATTNNTQGQIEWSDDSTYATPGQTDEYQSQPQFCSYQPVDETFAIVADYTAGQETKQYF